ncbi:hypothetical protein C8R48DRAFT_778775 [Suillus tomentosus]|nr:hypothetical protein C8R48DRAFT_778775 [Suillus tomentosus]
MGSQLDPLRRGCQSSTPFGQARVGPCYLKLQQAASDPSRDACSSLRLGRKQAEEAAEVRDEISFALNLGDE